MDSTYSISEVAAKLKLSDKTLRRWEDAGRFTPSRTLGNQRRYSIEDLQILDAIKHNLIESQSELLTLPQAAALAGVSPTTIERWEREGKLHPFVTSGKTYYPRPRLLSQLDKLQVYEQVALPPIPPPLEAGPDQTNPERATRVEGQPSLESSSPNYPLRYSLFTILSTLLLLTLYHLLFTSQPRPTSPQLTESATPQVRDSTLALLDSVLDKQGNLHTQGSLTAGQLSLLPGHPPGNPTPGTLYYDTGTHSLYLYTSDHWTDLAGLAAPPTPLTVDNSTLLSGVATLKKGADSVAINNRHVTPATPVVVTFTSDYSPAKKYWLELGDGSFTLLVDYPVGQTSTFSYLIFAPSPSASSPTF